MSAQPGWYGQPDGRQRYWDGQAWTQQTRLVPAPTAPQPPQQANVYSPAQPPDKRPFYTNKVFIVVAAVVALFVAASVFNGKGTQQAAAPVAIATVTATATVILEPTEEPTVVTEKPVVEPSEEPTEEESPAEVETFKMPKLIGQNLQDAQDRLQALDSWVMDQEDASGMERFQMLDSNWKVCTQKPKAGKVVTIDTVVVLASVKLDERCP